jgi:nitroimidazol reductase NimA-like FMN-containing flavoprotein (pyridoxamine 5'-phosphate oxidase superfamily)
VRELGWQECEDLLRRNQVGRLGVRDADGVYIVPISYTYHDGAIWGHSAPGHKLHLCRFWPHVAFQVDEVSSRSSWRSVLIKGHFEEIEDEPARVSARLVLLRAFDGDHLLVTAGHGHATTLADAVLFRIRIEDMSGRAENL